MAKAKSVPVERTSTDPTANRAEQLRALFPEAFADGKLDVDKLRAALGEVVSSGERFSFTWAGRSDAAACLLVPTRATLIPAPEESIHFDTTKNVYIEGDNLEVLKLLYKPYHGKVKLIYIDPPYNTGNDFIYPDDFRDTLANYLQLTKQADSAGNLLRSNPETSGRYHSDWLCMMYPRLFLARQLLRDDGVIFISIDDHEVHHLRMLMNEVFGEENFLAQVTWRKRYSPANDTINIATVHEYVIVYQRSLDMTQPKETRAVLKRLDRTEKQDSAYKNPDNDERGPWKAGDYTCNKTAEERPNLYYPMIHPISGEEVYPSKTRVWAVSQELYEQHVKDNRIWWGESAKKPSYKRFLSEVDGMVPSSWWDWQDCGHTDEAKKELLELMKDEELTFQTPKPTKLLKRVLSLSTQADDLIVDFFSGSATTAQAVLELNREDGGNRRFILVQLPEPTENKQYPTIAEIGKERIRRVIAKLKAETGNLTRTEPEDLGFKVFKLADTHYAPWTGIAERSMESLQRQMRLIVEDPLKREWTVPGLLWEIAIKEGFGLNSKIEEVTGTGVPVYRMTDPEKEPTQRFLACFAERIPADISKELGLTRADLFVVRDSALDDTLASNLALQCRLKTI